MNVGSYATNAQKYLDMAHLLAQMVNNSNKENNQDP